MTLKRFTHAYSCVCDLNEQAYDADDYDDCDGCFCCCGMYVHDLIPV